MRVRFAIERITTLSPKHAPTVVRTSKELRFSERRVRRSVLRMLEANVLCSIATVTKGHRAHISHLYFAYSEDLVFYFLSDPSSLHCRNLLTNPSMAMTVFSSSQLWNRPGRGVSFWGTCLEARGLDAANAERAYRERFPKLPEIQQLARDASLPFRYRFYRFVSRTAKVLDEPEFGGGIFVSAAIRRS